MVWVTKLTEVVLATMLTVLSVLVFAQVFLRYFYGAALFFADELSRYLLVWLGFLGGSLGVRAGAHIGVEFLWNALSPRARRVVALLVAALIFAFLAVITVGGVALLPNQLSQLSPGLGISMFWPYLAIPVGGILMLLQLVDLTLRVWRGTAPLAYLAESDEGAL